MPSGTLWSLPTLAVSLVLLPALVPGECESARFLPLEDPLNIWSYHSEAATGLLLPSVFPQSDVDTVWDSPVTGLIERRTSPLRTRLLGSAPDEGVALFTGGMISTEGLYLSEELETRAGGTLELGGSLLPSLSLHHRVSIWVASDETQPTQFSVFHLGAEEGRHLYVDWAFADWQHRWLSASFGRIPQRWGPGRFTQLLLSANSPSIDMLRVRYALGDRASFTGLTGSIQSDSAIYLAAHRLEIFPASGLRIGLSEAILFRSSGLELAYLNPFIPWYPVQWNERDDDNALLTLDAAWIPVRGLVAYGEFLIDDFQYLNRHDRPNKLGWTVGLDAWLDPLDLGAVLEYTRIDRWVYSQRHARNFYLHDDRIIGSELGPDADRLTLSLASTAAWPVAAELRLDHTRHGEGTVYEGWPDSAQSGQVFPSGTVEHTTGATLNLSLYPVGWLDAHGSIGKTWVRNAGNEQGEDDDHLEGRLQLILRW